MGEIHDERVGAMFPGSAYWSWDLAVPLLHVGRAIRILNRLGHEAEGMIAAPFFTLFLQSVDDKFVYVLLLHTIIMIFK